MTTQIWPLDGTTEAQLQLQRSFQWQGRVFGGIVLAAFALYGVGSALADRPVGIALVILNSIAVSYAGLIGFRLARSQDWPVGVGYLAARLAEALLLAGGILVAHYGNMSDADTTGYLVAMAALGIGSIPFCRFLGRRRWIPQTLAIWGAWGYAALAVGSLIELITSWSAAVVFAAPGGLFELAVGLYLLRYGFRTTTAQSGGGL